MSILLVDDEVELTEPLRRALRREGYAVEVAHDGETALQMIQTHQDGVEEPYELLILDWMLPKQSGVELCQSLRSQGDATPVLFLTAKDTLDARVQGLDAGADDYLVKPFELRELLARVRALLRRSDLLSNKAAGEDIALSPRISAEGLELDVENQVAYRNGRMIALSEKECRLLAFLMQHPQLLTHEEIYQQVWPTEEKPASNVLAAHIRLLRRKIEAPQEAPLIHTIYGKGYRFGTNVVD
jgi:two-component system, OmpR family, manganese sensing response regulator